MSIHRVGSSIWSSGEDGLQSKSWLQRRQALIVNAFRTEACVCECVWMNVCVNVFIRASVGAQMGGCAFLLWALDDGCGFTLYTIPSVLIKGRHVYD